MRSVSFVHLEATGIYTDSDVICGADHVCHCDIGYKDTDSKSCEKREHY